ncbi:MAG: hypothetical protein KDD35_05725 [Bdellovibrionales bacterium]|nr:hypothetical protein [Bdellovibrionales bacterium]
MAEFLGDIAFMFEVLILGLGLVVLHLNRKESSTYLKWAGRLMASFGVLGMICTGFFYMKYFFAGEFNQAHHMKGTHHSMMGMLQEDNEDSHIMTNPKMLLNMKKHMVSEMSKCVDKAQGNMMDAESKKMINKCIQENVDMN